MKSKKVKYVIVGLLLSLVSSISYNIGQRSAVELIKQKTIEILKESGH